MLRLFVLDVWHAVSHHSYGLTYHEMIDWTDPLEDLLNALHLGRRTRFRKQVRERTPSSINIIDKQKPKYSSLPGRERKHKTS